MKMGSFVHVLHIRNLQYDKFLLYLKAVLNNSDFIFIQSI